MSKKSAIRRLRDDPSSTSSSRAPSASRTPIPADDSDDEFIEQDLQRIQELLNQKLLSLQQSVESGEKSADNTFSNDRKQADVDALNKQRIQSEQTTINEIIASLQLARTEVSTNSRELLVAQLYKLIVSKPIIVYNEENMATANFVDEDKVQSLMNIFTNKNFRTETELLYLFRSIIALIASNIEDFGCFVTQDFLAQVSTMIQDPATSVVTNTVKANLLTGYSSITLILHHGAGNFGVDDKIKWLMEVAEGFAKSASNLRDQVSSGDREYSTLIQDKNDDKKLVSAAMAKVDAESAVCVSALHGIAALLTLLSRGEYLNEIAEDLMIKLVPLVDEDDYKDISKAAARVIAVIYEAYTYGEDSDDEDDEEEYNSNAPYYEQEYLFSIFDRLANLSSKKVSKKEKKEVHSVFRNVGNSLKAYVDKDTRDKIYKGTPDGQEILSNIMDSTYIRLSKYKSLPIDSWLLYARLRQLKWCFSFGLHNQLVCNDTIRDVLQQDNEHNVSSFDIDDHKLNDPAYADLIDGAIDKMNNLNEKARAAKIKKERTEKVIDRMGALNV
jgi:hypothetical protein